MALSLGMLSWLQDDGCNGEDTMNHRYFSAQRKSPDLLGRHLHQYES